MNITDPIRERAVDAGDRPALFRRNGEPVTYAAFDALLDHVGARFVEAGIGAGTIANIDLQLPIAQAVVALALARIGAAGAPPEFPADLAEARIVDGSLPQPGPAATNAQRLVAFDRDWLRPTSRALRTPSRGGGSDVAIVHASSGTTEGAKFIAVTHDQIRHRIEALERAVPLPGDPRVLCLVQPISCYGFDTLVRATWAGAGFAATQRVEDAAVLIERFRINHLTLNPLWIDRLIDATPPAGRSFPSLQRIESAGSHLARPRYEIARERLCPDIWNHYGSTEMGLMAAAPMSLLAADPQAVGLVPAGIEIEAVDDDEAPLPIGARGRLRARGAGMTTGYVRNASSTAEAFRDGWYVTADIGSIDADGMLALHGRLGELINVGGYKISPRLIEDALLSIDGVRDTAVFGVPDAAGITQLWAAVVVDAPSSADGLMSRVKARLASYAPRYLLTVPVIPRNAGGKVLRDRLIASAAASLGRAAD